MRRTLVVMVKEPRPVRVKTRLGHDIGMIEAAWWFRHQAGRLLRNVSDPRWDSVLAVSPDAEGLRSRVWPPSIARCPQGPGDLGDRMARALSRPGPVCVIGSDIPGVRRAHIARAFYALASHDVVFGPALDGGFWLIGARRSLPPRVFAGARWSTEHALSDALARLRDRRVAIVDKLADVDTAHDLAMTTRGERATPLS